MNRLVIVDGTRRKKGKEWMVLAKCECGTEKIYRERYILTGHTKSCGCIGRKHGLFKHPLYKVWLSMKERCHNPNHQAFRLYGGRGIYVSDKWRHSFEAFYSWANDRYQKGLELDRVDNDKGYTEENCRFVTPKENMRNRRDVIRLSYNGVSKPLTEWAEIMGLSIACLKGRLKAGWETGKMLTTPTLVYKR